MNKVAHYLQEHISGEIVTAKNIRRQFSTDASILTITPNVIIYPRNENDIRKTMRFTWQLAERGRVMPITARGLGTDQTGAAIGNGILIVFPAHMNKILELDSKSGNVIVEPGLNYGKLQQTLYTHDHYLPPFPASIEYSTIGGAIANNASGEKSLKYGSTLDYVKRLRVVLSNGDVIETGRISKKELSKKLGLTTFEGEIYRSLDNLIEENQSVIENLGIKTTKNSAGYNLSKVKLTDGSFDLTPLIVGSQGTLALVTQATLSSVARHSASTLAIVSVEDLGILSDLIGEIRNLPELPSAVEMVDNNLLDLIKAHNPNLIKDVIAEPFPQYILLIEFDSNSEHVQKRLVKRLEKSLKQFNLNYEIEIDPLRREELWKIRHSSVALLTNELSNNTPLPVINDGIVPPEEISRYIIEVRDLFDRHKIPLYVYGHAADGHLHIQPSLNLREVGDRQKLFKLMEDYSKLVIQMGGSVSGELNDGRLRASFLPALYGGEMYQLLKKVKAIFDPYGIMNPGVKFSESIEDIKPFLRTEYSLDHLYNYLPYI